jgi:ABC-2 type transport system permease protein
MRRLTRSTSKYWAIFKTQLITRGAYPLDLATQSISIVIYLWIFVQLWRAAYSSSGADAIAGLTFQDTIWYLMMTESILLSKPRLPRQIAQTVKDGSIAYLLNKPYNYLLYHVATGLADSLISLVFYVIIGGAVTWVLVGPPPPAFGYPLVLVAVLLGWLIDFCFAFLIGLAAFVSEDVSAFEWIYQKFLFILGGMLIPLDFFPGWLRTISTLTPFAYSMYAPARLFVDPTLERFLSVLLGQAGWLLVLGTLVTVVYRRGMRWLTVNGG